MRFWLGSVAALVLVRGCSSYCPNMNLGSGSYLESLSKRGPGRKQERGRATVVAAAPANVEPRARTDEDMDKSRTQRIMERCAASAAARSGNFLSRALGESTEADGQTSGSVSTWQAFLRAEESWTRLKQSESFDYDPKLLRKVQDGIPPPYQFCTQDGAAGGPSGWSKLRSQATNDNSNNLDYDVVVCGGTLGIFLATALQLKGHSVCVLEAGRLQGRDQEWNISRKDLMELVSLGVLSDQDAEDAITTEFKGCRSAFSNGYERFSPGVLNLGVAPSILIDRVAARFKSLGGTIIEKAPLRGVVVSELNGAAIDLGNGRKQPITARLVIDSMGNASPISRQQRYGVKPDGICAVVGTCAGGYDKETNLIGDIICTNTQITDKQDQGKMQYFWEAFPVGIGRNGKEPGTSDVKTTYMFTYMDADANRPSLETFMEDYWELLPQYQPSIKDPERDLDVHRVLFAFFPTYKDSPLKPKWSRILAVGDASGVQSPLSFGGFGALTRHLGRLSSAISEALVNDCLHKDDLGHINSYLPNLSASWLFQNAMSVRMGQKADPKFINDFLASNFDKMDKMGPLDGLAGGVNPLSLPQLVNHVGWDTTVDYLGHASMMSLYSALDGFSPTIRPFVNKMADPRTKFQWRRKMEAWKLGSGGDYNAAAASTKDTAADEEQET